MTKTGFYPILIISGFFMHKKACRTTSRLINQTYKTHYESPKIKIFLIYYLFLIYLFISLFNKQIRYGNNQKTEKRNKLKRTLHFA